PTDAPPVRVYALSLHDALPIFLAWGDELTRRVCDVAAFLLLKHRGFNPESGTDQVVEKAYDDAMAWFRRVGDGKSRPSGIIDSQDRKSTRLHSSHVKISYAVFC